MESKPTHLLIIDPQNDFCDLPRAYCTAPTGGEAYAPALPVGGAHADMRRLAALIDGAQRALHAITITLDSHRLHDIAHPTFWRDAAGAAIPPFTTVTASDVREGRYTPRDEGARERVVAYLEALAKKGRYAHMVWPVHCEIGRWGHEIHRDLKQACDRWAASGNRRVSLVAKGENPWTEHFSALMAEVPDPADPGTQLNRGLLTSLRAADRVYVAGEAGSHCVKATMEHLVEHWPQGELGRLTLIEDCVSPVGGFEALYKDFLNGLRAQGVRVLRANEVGDELTS